MHECGYVHNDLKLENILVGKDDPDTVYLIDFGLSTRYLDKNGNHKSKKFTSKFSGTFMYASMNSCRGNNKSRRDDMHSLIYIMVMLLHQRLPWSDFHNKYPGEPLEKLLRKKQNVKHSKEIMRMIPKPL